MPSTEARLPRKSSVPRAQSNSAGAINQKRFTKALYLGSLLGASASSVGFHFRTVEVGGSVC